MANAFIDQTIVHNFLNGISVTGGITQAGNQVITGTLQVTSNVELDGALNHDGTTVGLYGATPVAQAAQATALHATVTQAGTDTGDVAIQAAVDSSGGAAFGFAAAAEFEAIVAMVRNNNAVLTEIVTALTDIGIMAAS